MPSPLPPIGVPPFTLEGVYSAIAKAFNAAVDALAGKGFVVDVGERVSTVHLAYTGAVEETTGKSTIGLRVIGRMSARDPEAFNRLIDAFKNMLNPIGVRAPSPDILAPEPQEGPRFGPPPEEVMVASLNAGPVMTDEEVNLVSGRASFSMKGGPGAGWGGWDLWWRRCIWRYHRCGRRTGRVPPCSCSVFLSLWRLHCQPFCT